MITPKIKNLFQFIEYLHSNIDNFNLNNDLIKEIELLEIQREKVRHKKTFNDKIKYDEVQAEIVNKLKILKSKTANLIKAKAKELNVCNFEKDPLLNWCGVEAEIHQLKENPNVNDLPEITKRKNQYIEYRTNTHKTYLVLEYFFNELNEITKSLFDYFIETERNEFEAFETKAIQVNSIEEAVQLLTNPKRKLADIEIKTLQPQQENEKAEAKENLYNEYFKGNTFILFKEYCDRYTLNATCRVDLRFLFELFKKEGFFVDTMELKHYLKFLNIYLRYDNTELKGVDLMSRPNIIRTNNFNQIKGNLELTLK